MDAVIAEVGPGHHILLMCCLLLAFRLPCIGFRHLLQLPYMQMDDLCTKGYVPRFQSMKSASSLSAGKAGIRLSPFTKFMDSTTEDPYEVYGYLVEQLNKRELLYVHFVEPRV